MPLAVLVFTIVDISVRKFCTTFSVTLVGVRVGVSDIGLNKDEKKNDEIGRLKECCQETERVLSRP